MQNIGRGVLLGWLLLGTLACNLIYVDGGASRPASELQPVDTSTWVAYPGRGVRVGAPPTSWELVPTRATDASERVIELQAVDPSVANVFDFLRLLAANDLYRLILMKQDGTAWLHITSSSTLPNESLEQAVERQRENLANADFPPFNERAVPLPVGDSIRWTLDETPPNSQIINRQLQYFIIVDGQLYILTFSAQLPDFEEYAPLFETMALSFGIG